MGLKLNPEAQAALNLAKRAIASEGELDTGLLLAALYHNTALKEQLPTGLAALLQPPHPLTNNTPDKVQVATDLQPVLQQLAREESLITPNLLFGILVDSDVGHDYLSAHGMAETDIEALRESLNATTHELVHANKTEVVSSWRESPERREASEALSSYGRMLTSRALPSHGVFGMDQAIRSIVRTLSRMQSRNAIITGHPGTGKSAVIYEFARRLVEGHPSVPSRLRDLDIFELSPAFLRSGASVVGQYDERVKSLIQVLTTHPKIILFVDEIHSLFQSSMHERGPFTDANEAFKGVLGRGEITCIGCTTLAEYRYYIEPDKALARRFTEIRLDPPTPVATLNILKARRTNMEAYFSPLSIPDPILERTVTLTEDYLPSRYQPEKSLRLIDEACAWSVTTDPPQEQITETALWQALEDMIGHSVMRSEQLTEALLFDRLHDKIVGQDEALHDIARAFIFGLGDWIKRSGPRGVLLLCGPTGVGKTETALKLSEIVSGGTDALIRVDCNTLQGSGNDAGPAISVLLGASPGYLGYVRGQSGILAKIRDNPDTIVLFDEIEKAHPGVAKLLLQIMDDGKIDDNEGNTLDFRRAFIIFTTNAGSDYGHRSIGFSLDDDSVNPSPTVDVEAVKSELRSAGFGEEFLGRIGHFVIFQGLKQAAIRQIIGAQLERLRESADVKGYALEWGPDIIEHLTARWQPRFGVRHLHMILRNRIVEQLAVAEAEGDLKGIKTIGLRALAMENVDRNTNLVGLATRNQDGETLYINLA